MTQEQFVWRGGPSHVINLGPYILCVLFCWLIVPAFIGLWKYLQVRTTRYELTTQRLRVRTGVLSRETQDMELYRVRDYTVQQSFLYRLFSIADLVMETSDKTNPRIILRAVPNAEALMDQVREQVEQMRQTRGVREIDVQ